MAKSVIDELYDEEYFKFNTADSSPMAEFLVPQIVDHLGIKAVLDVGCANGHWLSCYERAGVDIMGIEGSSHAFTNLLVDKTKVVKFDLRNNFPHNKDVDLVMSIEVAEHLEPEYADVFVDTLTKHRAKYIIMTAAIPDQVGTGHYNCQPKDYWIKKIEAKGYKLDIGLFNIISYWTKDARDSQVWVPFWFPHNLMVFTLRG